MSTTRIALAAGFALAGLLALHPVLSDAAPRSASGAAPVARGNGNLGHGGQRPAYRGGSRGYSGYSSHGYSGYRNPGYPHGGWGLGVAVGVPWALGWYAPGWGGAYYPAFGYAYGPVYPAYGYACGWDEDCERARLAQDEPVPPTTVVPPPAPGEAGGPAERPLHLNFCESARAWYPQVRTCPGGWRFVRPEYAPPR